MVISKIGALVEETSPCEICGHPSVTVEGGKPRCGIHKNVGTPTPTDNIKQASDDLTPEDDE